MTATAVPSAIGRERRTVWIPRQHGAWAMLLVPVLLGVAASRPNAWQLLVAGAAISGYLASASLQVWLRARRTPSQRTPVVVHAAAFAACGTALAVSFPPIMLVLAVAGPAAIVIVAGARPGTRRDLANSLAQVAQAVTLVPATAYVSGRFDLTPVALMTATAVVYLVGTVLVVRSVLRERSNPVFAVGSVAFHAAATAAAVVVLPAAYALLAAALTIRAAWLPDVARRRAGSVHPLRPIQVGLVELLAAVAVVFVAFAFPA